jgi:hypothetical protein
MLLMSDEEPDTCRVAGAEEKEEARAETCAGEAPLRRGAAR